MNAKTIPRRVDFTNNADDYGAAIMGMMGFSTRAILKKFPGFSPCQVTYRLNLKHIKRADYRNGDSQLAQAMTQNVLVNRKEDFGKLVQRVNDAIEQQKQILIKP